MQPWEQRPIEEANLFNPAFCNAIIAKSVEGYSRDSGSGIPFSLSFLILPVILHQSTRRSLPRTTATTLYAWIESQQAALVGFPARVNRLRPVTREALIFGLHHSVLDFGEQATVELGSQRLVTTQKTMALFTDEARECINRSLFLGRWLARAGAPTTIMSILGVVP